jgi:hypothetical protein
LGEELGLTKSQLFPILFHLWARQPGHDVLAEEGLSALEAAIKGEGGTNNSEDQVAENAI